MTGSQPHPDYPGDVPIQTMGRIREADGESEIFAYLMWQWDVTAAKTLVQGRAPGHRLPVKEFLEAHLKAHLDQIDTEYAMSDAVDPSVPVIAMHFRAWGGSIWLVIDGWHRIYRAMQDGIEVVPAVVLTAREEEQIRRGTGWDP